MSQLKIGDYVRLKKGWTRMCIVGLKPDGSAIAIYASTRDAPEDAFINPWDLTNLSGRHAFKNLNISEFVLWTGDPRAMAKPVKYKTPLGNIGTQIGVTSSGIIALELDNGIVDVYDLDRLTEIKPEPPYTFLVTVLTGKRGYNVQYEASKQMREDGFVYVDALLLTEAGELCRIKEIDTKSKNTRGFFKGSYLSDAKIINDE